MREPFVVLDSIVLPSRLERDISFGDEPKSYPSIFLHCLSPDFTQSGYFSERLVKSSLLEHGTIRFTPLPKALTYVVEALIVSTIIIASSLATALVAPAIP